MEKIIFKDKEVDSSELKTIYKNVTFVDNWGELQKMVKESLEEEYSMDVFYNVNVSNNFEEFFDSLIYDAMPDSQRDEYDIDAFKAKFFQLSPYASPDNDYPESELDEVNNPKKITGISVIDWELFEKMVCYRLVNLSQIYSGYFENLLSTYEENTILLFKYKNDIWALTKLFLE